MRALIVGTGNVARVMAYHLSRGGAPVALLGRGRRQPAVLRLRRLSWRRGAPEMQAHIEGIDWASRLVERSWDVVVLTVPSPVIREPWVAELAALAPMATWVTLQPGLEDIAHVGRLVGADRLCPGAFSMLAFDGAQGLVAGAEPGTTCFWVPPGGGVHIGGRLDCATPIVRCLQAGGLSARHQADCEGELRRGGALLDPLAGALEQADFHLLRLERSPQLLRSMAGAMREALTLCGTTGVGSGLAGWLLAPGRLALGLAAARQLAPFDLAGYFATHYKKMAGQTRGLLRDWVSRAQMLGVDTPNLSKLLSNLSEDRTTPAGPGLPAMSLPSAQRLAQRHITPIDPSAPIAIKRNVHEFLIEAPASQVAQALRTLLEAPGARFGRLRLKRSGDHVGRPFVVGERFQGSVALDGPWLSQLPDALRTLLKPLVSGTLGEWVEDRLLSDYTEVTEISGDPADAPQAEEPEAAIFRARYAYLSGTPIAGHSELEVMPVGPRRARFRATFCFQEANWMAMAMMHGLGISLHDDVLASQVAGVCDLLGASLSATSLPNRATLVH